MPLAAGTNDISFAFSFFSKFIPRPVIVPERRATGVAFRVLFVSCLMFEMVVFLVWQCGHFMRTCVLVFERKLRKGTRVNSVLRLPIFHFGCFGDTIYNGSEIRSLLFLDQIANVIVSLFPRCVIKVLSNGAAPYPRITSNGRSTTLAILTSRIRCVAMVFVTNDNQYLFKGTRAIAKGARLLRGGQLTMLPDGSRIIVCVLLDVFLNAQGGFLRTIHLRPAPIMEPSISVRVVSIKINVGLLRGVRVRFTSPQTLATKERRIIQIG